jgi:ubiquinone/menaquinone biosynthesis C-methylase UbiE
VATFDERAKDWDTADRIARAGELAEVIRTSIPLAPTDRLADVGSGTGLLGLALVEDVGEVVLLDPSAGMIEVATAKIAAGSLPSVHAVRHDLLADPPPDAPFDVAVSLLVLHHIADTAAALSAIRDLIRAGGWIALADLDTEDGTFHSADAEGIHHRGFDRDALERIAEGAGFVEVATRTAMVLDRSSRFAGYSVFLLTARRG